MSENGSRARMLRPGTSTRWLVLGVFVTVLAAAQANAALITNTFIGFPPDPLTQQDKTWGGWTDVSGNLPTGFTTLIATRPNIVPGQDLHTFTLSGAISTQHDLCRLVLHYGQHAHCRHGRSQCRCGADRRWCDDFDRAHQRSLQPPHNIIQNWVVTVPSGPFKMLNVTDTVTTGAGSDISGFSNSFLEQITSTPEPGTLALFGSAALGMAGVLRRKLSK